MANDFYSWITAVDEFSDAGATVRAQALPPNDRDRLVMPIFFPEEDADSVKLSNLLTSDFRPAADRRDWNLRGRLIPVETLRRQELEMIPIESYFKLAEREMQELVERTLGNESVIREIIGVSLPKRTDGLVFSNRRREEFDAAEAWSKGTITAMNPSNGATGTVSYGFDAARYQTDSWAVTPYTKFLAWVQAGEDAIGGPSRGAVTRRAVYQQIQADAPQGINSVPLTPSQFEGQVQSDLGHGFTFYILENRLDKFLDAGLTNYARTNVWPAATIALVPAGTTVGSKKKAPVARAFQLARVNPDAEINVRGMSVFTEVAGNGREMTRECQINSFPVPNENDMWVNVVT